MTPPPTEPQFRALVERFVQEQGNSEQQAARLIGCSQGYLHDYLLGRARTGPRLAAYFGFVPQVVYVKKGNKE